MVLDWRTERAWLVAVWGRNPAPHVAVAAVAEAAKSAVNVPVVGTVVEDDEDEDEDDEEIVDTALAVHADEDTQSVVAFLSTMAAAIALPMKAKRMILFSIIGQF